jgi:hypothetical protein
LRTFRTIRQAGAAQALGEAESGTAGSGEGSGIGAVAQARGGLSGHAAQRRARSARPVAAIAGDVKPLPIGGPAVDPRAQPQRGEVKRGRRLVRRRHQCRQKVVEPVHRQDKSSEILHYKWRRLVSSRLRWFAAIFPPWITNVIL